MNYIRKEPATLIRPELQRLVLMKVSGQKKRTWDPLTFNATTANLVAGLMRVVGK